MEGTVERILENPIVRTSGKIGAVVIGAAVIFKAGKWAWNKSANFRKEVREEFNKVREEIKAKKVTEPAPSTEEVEEAVAA